MRTICVICNDSWFGEFAREMASWPDVTVVDASKVDYEHADDPAVHYHIWATRQWLLRIGRLPPSHRCKISVRYIEQIPLHGVMSSEAQISYIKTFVRYLDRIDRIVVKSKQAAEYLRNLRPQFADRILAVPIGHTSQLGSPDFSVQQDIDLFIYGSKFPRRVKVIQYIATELRDLRVITTSQAWGEERNAAIRRSKIVLNVQSVPKLFPSMRMWRAFANGAFWVTEDAGDPWPGVIGEDLQVIETISTTNLAEECQKLRDWISDTDYRDGIRKNAHEKASKLTMRMCFDEISRSVQGCE